MTLLQILTAFGGGMAGSLIGGTMAFAFAGLTGLIGIILILSTGDSTFLDQITFGPFLGPHVAFAGAVAAAAFAGQKSLLPGSDADRPLFHFKDPSVLLVGGMFGVIGHIIERFLASTGIPMDTVATTVVISGVLVRLLITRSSLLSTSDAESVPETDTDTIYDADGDDGITAGSTASTVLFDGVWAFGLGLITAFIVDLTGIESIGFALSAASLFMAYSSAAPFPVTHHVTMVAGYAMMTFDSYFIAAIFAVIAVITGIFVEKWTNMDVKSHLDMPAVIIALYGFIILALF